MIRFEQPLWFLLLLPVGAALVLWARETLGASASMIYPAAGSLPVRTRGTWLRWTPALIRAFALVLATGAMSRPQAVSRQFAGLAEGIDIILTLDTSLSMHALDFKPLTRMSAAKSAASDFVAHRRTDRIGVVIFGGEPLLTCPLTLDYAALQEYLGAIEAGMTRSQGTAIGDGIASSVDHLKDSTAESKVIILLTDGASNVGLIDPLTAAKAAQTYGIKIHTIGTGRRGPAEVDYMDPDRGRVRGMIDDELDEEALLRIALETGGKYFRATSLGELEKIYAEIDSMEKTEYDRPEIVSYEDLHPFLLIPAALLIGLELLLTRTLLLRIP